MAVRVVFGVGILINVCIIITIYSYTTSIQVSQEDSSIQVSQEPSLTENKIPSNWMESDIW